MSNKGRCFGYRIKYPFFLLLIIFQFVSPFFSLAENDLIKVKASVSPQRLSKGQEGKLVLKIIPEKDISIANQPYFIIEIDPLDELIFPKNFYTASDLEIESIKTNGVESLNLKNPLEILFSVKMDAVRKKYVLKGKIKYFARSNKDEVCIKTKTEFSASFNILNRIYKKK